MRKRYGRCDVEENIRPSLGVVGVLPFLATEEGGTTNTRRKARDARDARKQGRTGLNDASIRRCNLICYIRKKFSWLRPRDGASYAPHDA